jgi:para-aminobenzoate synthetase/4-amino-4-deoxychorismate lyase
MRKRSNPETILLDEYGMIHPRIVRWVNRTPDSVLLETTRHDRHNRRSFLFHNPIKIVSCYRLEDVEQALAELDDAVRRRMFAAGFIAYEAGYAFERAFDRSANLPDRLLWFGVYEDPVVYNHARRRLESGDLKFLSNHDSDEGMTAESMECVGAFEPSLGKDSYAEKFRIIKEHILEGDTYQVNFTFKLKFQVKGEAAFLYLRLRQRQRVGYAAFLNTGVEQVLSFSPEMFFRQKGSIITLKPMKGTAPRGRTNDEDGRGVAFLRSSEKNRAENLMIVDLLRNDVGRIAVNGSVHVPRFFDIEKYETVLQATSTVQARLKPKTGVQEIVRALFPSGSVTGAPKIRTMQIIQALENEPRGVYTGAIGYWGPRHDAMFNVAIRTIRLNPDGRAEMGVGSGVVSDSSAEAEYEECLLKGKFLTEEVAQFKLIETIRWDRTQGWFLLPHHLKRLRSSARYFDFSFQEPVILRALRTTERTLRRAYSPDDAVRVRLLLDRTGKIEVEYRPLTPLAGVQRAIFSPATTDSRNRFLFHKSTNRALYDAVLRQCREAGYFDAVFTNERGEVTEGARSNVVVLMDGELYTPPIGCGLLAGTFRQHLLEQGTLLERILTAEDVRSAQEVYLCNALYGLVPVSIVAPKTKEGSSYAQSLVVEN